MPDVVDPSEDWVEMTHSSSADAPPARVLRAAYDDVWSDKGWKLVSPSAAAKAAKKGEVA